MIRFAMLIDPFRAVHGYTGILLSFGLKLPGQTWKIAIDRIRLVLSVGPLLDIPASPAYDDTYELRTQDQLKVYPKNKLPNSGVVLPTPLVAQDWIWLQPYAMPAPNNGADSRGKAAGSNNLDTIYMCLPVGKRDNRPRLEKAPYTVVEGYLLLGKPVTQYEPDYLSLSVDCLKCSILGGMVCN